ncbi:MAG: DUF1080 domain-containing protein [Bryobacterales bacterium]|nr:DUF1080 domain-containing protein [Bryobacterales bacterium]
MHRLLIALLLIAATGFAQLSKEEKKEGFKPMFNGKNLKGWDGDPRLWKVEKGVVIGSTDGVTLDGNTFLICKQEYSDFVLRAQVKLRNHNSGIQFRSEALPNWVVKGLQADMAEGNWWGSIYDEKGKRGVISNGWKGKAEKVVKANDWNDYEIVADGEKIEIRVNGLLTSAINDNSKMSGVIALQLHRGPGMQAEFRNVRIKKLR